MITDKILHSLRLGEISFNMFEAKHRSDFAAMSAKMARQWGRLPASMEVDDLSQIMMLSVYETIGTYDPERGSIRMYVIFGAHAAARLELRRAASRAGRDEIRYSTADSYEPIQEAVVLARERAASLPHGARQRAIIHSLLQTMSFEDTTRELLDRPETRAMFGSPTTAMRSVYRTAVKLRNRAAVA